MLPDAAVGLGQRVAAARLVPSAAAGAVVAGGGAAEGGVVAGVEAEHVGGGHGQESRRGVERGRRGGRRRAGVQRRVGRVARGGCRSVRGVVQQEGVAGAGGGEVDDAEGGAAEREGQVRAIDARHKEQRRRIGGADAGGGGGVEVERKRKNQVAAPVAAAAAAAGVPAGDGEDKEEEAEEGRHGAWMAPGNGEFAWVLVVAVAASIDGGEI